MNYRHAYHAGNFADVLKHGVLCWVVRYLQQKEAPLALIDTHAGPGFYDLEGPEAQKTAEAKDGILRLAARADVPAALAPYLQAVRALNGDGALRRYPGSPTLFARLARSIDRVTACELHTEDGAALRAAASSNVRVILGDGYRALPGLIPPPEKRGVVLIDPPFEAADEFEHLAKNFIAAHRKWPTGVFVIWVPIKDPAAADRFAAELANAAIPKLTRITLDVDRTEGLGATGLVLCNAPFTLPAEWSGPLAWLASALAQGPRAKSGIEQLTRF